MSFNKILIIDDDEMDRYLSKRIISENTFAKDVVTASSVGEAMDLLSASGPGGFPDLIFLDLNMPDQNGLKFLEMYETLGGNEKTKSKIVLLMNVVNSQDAVTKQAQSHPLIRHVIEKPLTAEKLFVLREKS